ncbi:MAG: hypothetical protein JF609_03460 [Verrucomicrobia bacterium]|nr:hypothetical protein [Verrucomicrobiota bacterium]
MQPATDVRPRCDVFFALALAYLVVPDLIFLLSWVRPMIGIPAALIVVGAACWLVCPARPAAPRPGLSRRMWFAVVALAGLWTLIIGVGGIFPQTFDYMKHNLLFHDLTTMSWPVNYPHDGGSDYLCYGLGYYLVPAAGGCLLGAGAVPALTFLWTFAGLVLFFYWAATLTTSPVKTLAAILFFATTGVLWLMFKRHGIPGLISPEGLETRLLNNGLYFNYNDSFTRFDYQPQHALAGWLGAALMIERLWVRSSPRGVVFLWAACLLWSPLTCLGLLLISLGTLRRVRWLDYFEPVNLLGGGVLIVIMGIYFQGHLAMSESGFIWKFSNGLEWLYFYALFVVVTLSPLLFLALFEQKYRVLGEWRALFFTAIAALVLLPLYKIGFAGDLRLQASAPALVILALAAVRILQSEHFSLKQPLCVLLAGSLVLGAVYPVTRPWINLLSSRTDYSYDNTVRTTGARTLAEIRTDKYDAAVQYLGRSDSLAARRLLR